MEDRDRYLTKLSPAELLLYVAGGGELVTRRMRTCYVAAAAAVGVAVAPTAEAMAALARERLPRGRPIPPKPLVYLPLRAPRRTKPRKRVRIAA